MLRYYELPTHNFELFTTISFVLAKIYTCYNTKVTTETDITVANCIDFSDYFTNSCVCIIKTHILT